MGGEEEKTTKGREDKIVKEKRTMRVTYDGASLAKNESCFLPLLPFRIIDILIFILYRYDQAFAPLGSEPRFLGLIGEPS